MKVLIVEDDPNFTFVLRHVLRPYTEDIQTAHSLFQLNTAIADDGFDLIILDLYLTDSTMEGTLAFVPELRKKHPEAVILAMSGADAAEHPAIKSVAAGCDGFIAKVEVVERGLAASVAAAIRIEKKEGMTDDEHMLRCLRLQRRFSEQITEQQRRESPETTP